jgi:LPXTG-motif cell wall-anchored protein
LWVEARTVASTNTENASARGRKGRLTAALTVLACGLAMLGAAFVVAPSAGATGTITVESTPLNYSGPCLPSAIARLQWTSATESTDEYFRLKVTNPADVCDPVTATAVIYGMPDNGQQWPQQLLAAKDFVIGDASVTTITFTKDCQPAQFDVVTGETPQQISPTGAHHGPLLFPFDVNTSVQYNGPGCGPTTTATVLPTSTVQTTTTTTEAPTTTASVAAVTTIKTDSGEPPASVESETAAQEPSSLALTGSASSGLAVIGGALLVAGAGLLLWSRRTRPVEA